MNTRKMLKSILCAFTLLFTTISVNAEEVDTTKTGSITITLDKQQVSGGSLRLYQIATVEDNKFVYTNGYENCGISLDKLDSDTAKALAKISTDTNTSVTQSVVKGSNVVFNQLQVGLYLVVQDGSFENYQSIDPFLVSIPQKEGESYIYDVDASPKVGTLTKVTPTTPPSEDIPNTGQLNWPIPVLATSGILLIVVGWYLLKKGNNAA